MSAIFKGNTAACIAHLYDVIQNDYQSKRHTIAAFAGVDDRTVGRWFTTNSKPTGEALVKVRFYLDFLGYQVDELQALDPLVRSVARIYAFGIISLENMATAIGYAGGRNSHDHMLRVFRGVVGIASGKVDRFNRLVDQYNDQLVEKKRETAKVIPEDGSCSDPVREVTKPTPIAVRLAVQQPLGTHEALIESLAGLVMALIPLAREVSSDRFTPEERARVRELAGGDGVFTLANLLFRLCGERARKMHS